MKKTTRLLSLFFVMSVCTVNAQLNTEGDIAFSSYNTDDKDSFSFVLLKDISETTTIFFTDDGFNTSTNSLIGAEGTIEWTSAGSLPEGTEISIFNPSSSSPSTSSGSLTKHGSYNASSSGDSLIAYIGNLGTPTTYLASVCIGTSSQCYVSGATSTNETGLAMGLTLGTNAMTSGTGVVDNIVFDCNNGNITTVSGIRAALNTYANFTTGVSNDNFSAPGCNYLGTLSSSLLSTVKATITNEGNRFVSPDSSLEIQVYNTLGQKVSNESLSSGIYILKVTNENGDAVLLKRGI